MEVTHLEQFDTHAVIGGAKAQAFRMAETAEFFTVLSDTLYSNKKLAVVREVICNAWDAHIKAGKKDMPVRITLNDKELVIEDQGPGIPEDAIVDIYCTYGKSTKVQDDDQTGGFGLGSKAPFAYTSHFTVTNRHRGFRTIYAVSRGSTQTGGKPDIRQMVRVPDDTTGVTVTIPLVSDSDRRDFEALVKTVVKQGDINATLNGEKLGILDLSLTDKIGFTLAYCALQGGRFFVRYGSVIYPIDMTHQDLKHLDPLRVFSSSSCRGVQMIFRAPPNSIGVTPSRESLSYTERTIDTIKALMTEAEVYLAKFRNTGQIIRNERQAGARIRDLYDLFRVAESSGFYDVVSGSTCGTEDEIGEFLMRANVISASKKDRIIAKIQGFLAADMPREFATKKGEVRRALRLIKSGYKSTTRSTYARADLFDHAYAKLKERAFWKRNRTKIEALRPLKKVIEECSYHFANSSYYHRAPEATKHDMDDFYHLMEKKNFNRIIAVESKAEFQRWFESETMRLHLEWQILTKRTSSATSHEFREWRVKGYSRMLLITRTKQNSKVIPKIAEALGITDIVYASVEKKPVEVESKLYDAAKIDYQIEDGVMRFKIKDKVRVNEKFDLMIPCRNPREGDASVYPEHRYTTMDRLIRWFNDKNMKVGLILNASERKLAIKNDIRCISDAINEELEKILKSKKILKVISLRRMDVNCDDWNEQKLGEKISDWLRASEEFRRLIIPALPKLNEEETRLYDLWTMINSNNDHNARQTTAAVMDQIRVAATKVDGASAMLKELRLNNFKTKFPGIEHLTGSMTPRLLEILKKLHKDGAKAKKGETANV